MFHFSEMYKEDWAVSESSSSICGVLDSLLHGIKLEQARGQE